MHMEFRRKMCPCCCVVLCCLSLLALYTCTAQIIVFSSFQKFLKPKCCSLEVSFLALAEMLLYLQANNRKITPQDNKMQLNKSSQKKHSQKIGQTSHPNRLGYKTQSKYTKSKSSYPTGTISPGNASLCLNIKDKSGGRRGEYR